MSAIEVLEAGLFTTVQDLGREGFGAMGVSACGAADALSLRVGNKLLGNAEGAAGLEMTLLGGTFLFREGASIALAGSDFGATLDGNAVATLAPTEVRSGQRLCVGSTLAGARCYLCVRGGILVPAFLGSASTHILSGLGGYEGRALKKGDVLAIGDTSVGRGKRGLSERARKMLLTGKTLRVTPGPQRDWFAAAIRELFYASAFRVTEDANRMGLRLAGPAVARASERELISEGVALGAVQVPESGMPIILFVEQQTTGGYPKIANVIAADFHRLGQLRPRDEIRFEPVSWEAARAAFLELENLMASEELLFV